MKEPNYIKHTETESTRGDRIVLYYFTNEKRMKGADNEAVCYGIGIDMYTQLPGERTLKERKIVEDVFKSKSEAEKFIDLLCRGSVTPATLEDIIADCVS